MAVPWYDNENDAAAAALAFINKQPHANQREYIGLIFQDPNTGKFQFTKPKIQSGRRSKGKAKGTFRVPQGSVRGIIHNHPGDSDSRGDLLSFLSPDDVSMARKLGVPSYIGVGDRLLSWDPKNGKVRGVGSRQRGIATEVLSKIPMGMLSPRLQERVKTSSR